AGATVTYAAAAADAIDPSPTLLCRPSSGAAFAIGTTTVACTAADAAGNTTTGSFAVLGRGAAAQLHALRAFVAGLDVPGQSYEAQLAVGTCAGLAAFENHVAAQAGKQLSPAEADRISADADRIRAVLGCAI